MTSGIIENV